MKIQSGSYVSAVAKVVLFAAASFYSLGALAQAAANQGVVGMKSNTAAQASATADIIYILAAVGGIASLVMGVMKLYHANKDGDQSRESQGTGWKLMGIGVLALTLTSLVYFVGGTIWGDGQTATQQQRTLINK